MASPIKPKKSNKWSPSVRKSSEPGKARGIRGERSYVADMDGKYVVRTGGKPRMSGSKPGSEKRMLSMERSVALAKRLNDTKKRKNTKINTADVARAKTARGRATKKKGK